MVVTDTAFIIVLKSYSTPTYGRPPPPPLHVDRLTVCFSHLLERDNIYNTVIDVAVANPCAHVLNISSR